MSFVKKFLARSKIAVALAKKVLVWCLEIIPADKPLGTKPYNAISRHSFSITFEAVMLRQHGDAIEVFMTRRSATDSIESWRGMLHVPGIVMFTWEMGHTGDYAEEDDYSAPAKRLSKKELGGIDITWRKVGSVFSQSVRGRAEGIIFLVESDQDPAELGLGEWYDTENIPPETLGTHKNRIIPFAVRAFKAQRSCIGHT